MRTLSFVIILFWVLALCGADPVEKSKLRSQLNKDKKEMTIADYWKDKTDDAADRAELIHATVTLRTDNLKQVYFFIIYEYKGDLIRRKNICRTAVARQGHKAGYVSYIDRHLANKRVPIS